MGALECTLVWTEKVKGFTGGRAKHVGQRVHFKIGGGFADAEREWNYVDNRLPIGKRINFTFLGVSNDGVPVHANCNE